MAGQDWAVVISGTPGQTQFNPNPLHAQNTDIVFWSNQTDQPHQIAITGGLTTDVIQPWTSSSPAYVCKLATNPPGTIAYKCITHPGANENGTIDISG
jgi:plastocyanin